MSRLGDDRRAREVLARGAVLHAAVDTSRGPHVTPAAYDWSGGALWMITTRDSVKVRALRRRPRAGVLIRSRRYDLVVEGEATIVDPLHGRGITDPMTVLELPFAGLGYLGRNSRHALAMVRDAAGPGLVLDRLVVRIEPSRAVLASGDDGEVLRVWGRWTEAGLLGAGTESSSAGISVPTRDGLPAEVTPLLDEPGPACLAWPTVHGPMPLPAHWPGSARPAEVNAELLKVVGAKASGLAGLALSTGEYRLASKRGVLLRGEGTAVRDGSGRAWAGLDTHHLTYWVGAEAGTVSV